MSERNEQDPPLDLARGRRRDPRIAGRLRTAVVMAIVAAGIVTTAVLVDQPSDTEVTAVALSGDVSGPPPAVGALAPDFSVRTTEGETLTLSELRGRPVWLTFGASWCVDCRVEAPDLQTTYERYRDDGLVVLQVSVGEEDTAIREYAERVGQTFTFAADPQTTIASRYRVLGIPTHLFLDRDGTVHEIRIGGMPLDQMTAAVEAILGSP